jgi:hypothetical protein
VIHRGRWDKVRGDTKKKVKQSGQRKKEFAEVVLGYRRYIELVMRGCNIPGHRSLKFISFPIRLSLA